MVPLSVCPNSLIERTGNVANSGVIRVICTAKTIVHVINITTLYHLPTNIQVKIFWFLFILQFKKYARNGSLMVKNSALNQEFLNFFRKQVKLAWAIN